MANDSRTWSWNQYCEHCGKPLLITVDGQLREAWGYGVTGVDGVIRRVHARCARAIDLATRLTISDNQSKEDA